MQERIAGLRAGGDDYLTKPFAFGELAARLDALGSAFTGDRGSARALAVGDLKMDLLSRKVTRGDKAIQLQPREFKLLEFLMRHAGHVVTRTMLLENVWDYHFDPQTNVIDTHISNSAPENRCRVRCAFATENRPGLRIQAESWRLGWG